MGAERAADNNASGCRGCSDHAGHHRLVPPLAERRERRGEARPCEAGVETLSTQPPPIFTLGDHNAKHGSGRSIRPTQHVERKADLVGGKINRADTIGSSAT